MVVPAAEGPEGDVMQGILISVRHKWAEKI